MWVVKVGGSLATDETLPYWLDVLSCYGGGEVVIVPGGGPFSELVMKSQGFWNFDDSSAHRMALMAMGQYGVMMAGMRPDLEPVESLPDIKKVLNRLRKKKSKRWFIGPAMILLPSRTINSTFLCA